MTSTFQNKSQASNWIKPPGVFSFEIDESKQVEALNNIDFLTIAFKPCGRDGFHLMTEGAHGNVISLWKSAAKHGFVSAPKSHAEKFTIRFVSGGKIVRRNGKSEFVGEKTYAMFVEFDQMTNEEASPDFQALTATVDRSALINGHLALEGEDAQPLPDFLPLAETTSAGMRAFYHNFNLVFERLRAGVVDGDLTYPLLEELLIYQFLAAWPRSSSQNLVTSPARPSWQVRRATEYIEANLKSKLSLVEIANAAHTGVRSLQISFRKELNSTPLTWILERRLSGAHNDLLLEHGLSIALIARQWGFAHISDFNRRYKIRYGCTPQETRRSRN